jgi:predicted transcriptional regulator
VTLCAALEHEQLAVDLVVLNAIYPMRFGDGEVEQLASALRGSRSRLSRSALSAALSEHARALAQREQQARLAEEVNGRMVELPYVFADHLGPAELERLTDALEAGVGSMR